MFLLSPFYISMCFTMWWYIDKLGIFHANQISLCLDPHHWYLQTCLSPPVKQFTDRSKEVLHLWILFVICVPCLSLQPCGHLMGKCRPLGSLVCDVFSCFCHFPLWCPGSGVVFDCIDSWSCLLSYFHTGLVIILFHNVNSTHQNTYAVCTQKRSRMCDNSICLQQILNFDK